MPDAKIEKPTDVLVRITSTNICGSDLHMYEGRTDMQPGGVFGHENLGQVIEVGSAVDRVKVGDWVAIPFNIGCGFCENCERGSERVLPDHGGSKRCRTWRAPPTASPTWDRIAAARPICCACPTATTTA